MKWHQYPAEKPTYVNDKTGLSNYKFCVIETKIGELVDYNILKLYWNMRNWQLYQHCELDSTLNVVAWTDVPELPDYLK